MVKTLIIIHAGLGGIALLAGAFALYFKKGSKPHKSSGLLFYFSMLASAVTALIVSVLPGHENPFLFSIGLFSSYFILLGRLALKLRNNSFPYNVGRALAYLMMLIGISMVVLPVLSGKLNIVLLVFGIVALFFAVRDLRLYKDQDKAQQLWQQMHLGNMIGGYIAASTAFVVVNQLFPWYISWFAPGLIGGLFIYYWLRKVS